MPEKPDSGPLYIGLMSGTSMDGIDAALISFADHECDVLMTAMSPYPEELRSELVTASRQPETCTVDKIGQLDRWVAECFANAALQLIEKSNLSENSIVAIGSHGQTLRHQPRVARPFTLQIGDPNIIAYRTGLTTVADFRRRDLAAGGEGAPLAPAFHHWLFSDDVRNRCVLNIGGIANVTMLLTDRDATLGFDTGPGNFLMDNWIRRHRDKPFDENGAWAGSGSIHAPLLAIMLDDPYFELPPPKSTGFEYFNNGWIHSKIASLGDQQVCSIDVQTTLAELTAKTIATSVLSHARDIDDVLVCGGGAHNSYLMSRLRSYLSGVAVTTTDEHGLHPDWVEAAAFAWLAKRRLTNDPSSLPEVTGASSGQVLGAVYSGGS